MGQTEYRIKVMPDGDGAWGVYSIGGGTALVHKEGLTEEAARAEASRWKELVREEEAGRWHAGDRVAVGPYVLVVDAQGKFAKADLGNGYVLNALRDRDDWTASLSRRDGGGTRGVYQDEAEEVYEGFAYGGEGSLDDGVWWHLTEAGVRARLDYLGGLPALD